MTEDKSFARVEALDEIAAQFASSSDKVGLIASAKEKISSLSGDDKANGELYVKLMEKAVEKVCQDRPP